MLWTKKREGENGVEYLCPIDGWIKISETTIDDGSGYSDRICSHCGALLEEDINNNKAYENGTVSDER